MSTITPDRRRELAAAHGLSDAYLYQCLTKRRDMDAAEARRVETITKGEIRRWMVRRDWHEIWPELIGSDGAPEPVAKPAAKSKVKAERAVA